jgi:CMP-2-keto-3-deoxyoctulosonic acid synthetase
MPKAKGSPKTGGRRAGTPNHATIDKVLKREELRRIICAHLEEMTDAQVANAKGIKYLVTRHKNSGKFIRVTEAMAKVKLGDDEEIIEVWEKDPSVQAYTDLLNRALDKPAEQVQVTGADGGPLEIVLKVPW